MKKWQLVSTGVILSTLLVSNGVLLNQYKVDTNNLEKKINNQKELIKSNISKFNKTLSQKQGIIDQQQQEINNLNQTIQDKSSEIATLQQQLTNAQTRNESPMRQMNMQVTAYTSNCTGCSGLTFTEYNVRNTVYYQGYNIIAADFNKLPLYSIVEIKTDSRTIKAIVLDTGGLIRNSNVLDLLVGTYDEAMQFGRQNATVTVIREGKG
jgi:3D (Asp-Asp-Asp) domain-containing protein